MDTINIDTLIFPGEPMPETEGLPLLGGDRADIVDTEADNTFSFENRGVDMLTELTTDNISPPYTNHFEDILGMPIDKALKIWHSKGAPVIHLEAGVNCFDLEELLTNPNTPRKHPEAVKNWLEGVNK